MTEERGERPMRITASSTYDRETVRDMTRFAMFRKHEPKKRMLMWTALFCVLIIVLIAEMLLWGYSTYLLVLAIFATGFLLLEWFFYLRLPAIQYRNAGKIAGAKNEFVFTEKRMEVSSTAGDYVGSAEMEYDTLYRIYETGTYFFLYLQKGQYYVVNKATVRGGSVEELRSTLIGAVGGRYVRCHY